ncbi:hypothetical protein EDB80DRAFT_732740 [Ilyonectria destructans]|nr:hypothetical protein EDB80DRAFT_732740 [Ilyonectria destructans]
MCHTVVAQRVCQVCNRGQGETVIDFTRCARKCSSPFYCLTPKPHIEICFFCAPKTTTPLSTPVTSRNSSIDADANDCETVSTAAAAATAAAVTAVIPAVSVALVPSCPLS